MHGKGFEPMITGENYVFLRLRITKTRRIIKITIKSMEVPPRQYKGAGSGPFPHTDIF
jgi:hypothetical protein